MIFISTKPKSVPPRSLLKAVVCPINPLIIFVWFWHNIVGIGSHFAENSNSVKQQFLTEGEFSFKYITELKSKLNVVRSPLENFYSSDNHLGFMSGYFHPIVEKNLEGVEKEYAVYDTRQALIEARQKGITPFCLTVDKSGHDYLKTMMDDFSYEVLSDISMLPARLPELYKNLTT